MRGWIVAMIAVGVLVAAAVGVRLLLAPNTPAWIACAAPASGTPALQRKIAGCDAVLAARDHSTRAENAYRMRGYAYYHLHDFERAIADYGRALQLNPDDTMALVDRGLAYVAGGDYDHGIADDTQALQIKATDAIAFNNRGFAYRAEGFYDRSILDFDQALEISPNSALAYANRGYAFADKDQYEVAIPDFTNAIRLNPSFAYAYEGRGFAPIDKGDKVGAMKDFDQAVTLAPDDSSAYAARGLAHAKIGDFASALRDLNHAISLSPTEGWPYLERAQAYFDKGDYAHAITDDSQAIKLKPNDARAYNARCWSRAAGDIDLDAAMADCRESLALRPGMPGVMDSVAFVSFRQGRLAEAINEYSAALAKNPRLPSSLFVRGVAKLRTGDAAGGAADIAAGKAIRPKVVEEYATFGVKP